MARESGCDALERRSEQKDQINMKTTIRITTPIFGLPAGTVIESLRSMTYDRPGWAEFVEVTGNCQCAKISLPETHFEPVGWTESAWLKYVDSLKYGWVEGKNPPPTRGRPMFTGNEESDPL